MYADYWCSCLRQGDVIGPIPLPVIPAKPIVTSQTSPVATAGAEITGMLVDAKPAYAVILSHDCEFLNEGKAERILLARVQSIDKRADAERMEEIRSSNDVRARLALGGVVHGVDSFLLDPIPGHLDDRKVAAFRTLVSYSNTPATLTALYHLKRAELQHSQRLLLKHKLAWFFLRSDEDLPDEEKRPKDVVLAEIAAAAGG